MFLAFIQDGVVCISSVLWSSLMFDGALSDWQADALKHLNFIRYNPGGCRTHKLGAEIQKIFQRDPNHATYYVPHHFSRYIVSYKNYENAVLLNGYEYNIDFSIPLAHAAVRGELNYLMAMPNRADDYNVYEGVTHAL